MILLTSGDDYDRIERQEDLLQAGRIVGNEGSREDDGERSRENLHVRSYVSIRVFVGL